jgi:hypothetical protein
MMPRISSSFDESKMAFQVISLRSCWSDGRAGPRFGVSRPHRARLKPCLDAALADGQAQASGEAASHGMNKAVSVTLVFETNRRRMMNPVRLAGRKPMQSVPPLESAGQTFAGDL